MLVWLFPIPNHCRAVTEGCKKRLYITNTTRITVPLFLKLKVRSVSTSQQNDPPNRWLRIILTYTSPYWIKISLLRIVYWGQHSFGRRGWAGAPLILSHSQEPYILHWEQNSYHWSERSTEHSWGAMNSGELPHWSLTAKIPAFLPLLLIFHSLPQKQSWFKFPIFPP